MFVNLICDIDKNTTTEIDDEKYNKLINSNIEYIDQLVYAKIDRPLGSKLIKEHPDFVYEVNYGFIPNTISGDGEELDCYILGINEPIENFKGKCIAIVHRINEDDDKLILVPENINLSFDEIEKEIFFSEKHHKSFLFMK